MQHFKFVNWWICGFVFLMSRTGYRSQFPKEITPEERENKSCPSKFYSMILKGTNDSVRVLSVYFFAKKSDYHQNSWKFKKTEFKICCRIWWTTCIFVKLHLVSIDILSSLMTGQKMIDGILLTTGFWGKEAWRPPSKWNTRFFFAFSKRTQLWLP